MCSDTVCNIAYYVSVSSVTVCGRYPLCGVVVVRGKVIQGCMEETGDVVEAMNSALRMLVGEYGALVNLAENFNLSVLKE